MIIRSPSSGLISRLRLSSSVLSSYEPETLNWQARVQARGGSVDGGIAAIDTYIKILKNHPTDPWAVMSNGGLIMVLATDTFAGLIEEPLIAPANVTPANVGFVAGDYSLGTGLDPGLNNSTKRINTNYILATWLTAGSAQMSVYCREDRINSTGNGLNVGVTMGADDAINRRFLIALKTWFNPGILSDVYDSNARINTSALSSAGLSSVSRTSTTLATAYLNGSPVGSTVATTIGTLPSTNAVSVFSNSPPTNNPYENRILSYAYIGRGLSAAQEAVHNTAVQAYNVALGRGV